MRPVRIPNHVARSNSEVADALALEDSACVSGNKAALSLMHGALELFLASATCSHTSMMLALTFIIPLNSSSLAAGNQAV